MNQQFKLVLGIGATILAGVAAVKLTPSARFASDDLVGSSPANAQQRAIEIVFPSRAGTTDLETKATAVTTFLSKELQQPVKAVFGDETAAVEALRANRADVAFLSSRAALKAQQLANASLYLAEVRANYSGGHTYKSVFVVPKNSALTSGQTVATLSQLQGKRISFTSPTSGSGFIFPVAELVRQKLVPNRDRLNTFFSRVTYGGSYDKALQAVLRGQADVAAVSEYSLGAPYITAEEAKNLRVIYSIAGVPAHGVVIDDDVSASDRNKIITAMMKFNQPANNKLFTALYNSTKLVKVDGVAHLKPTRVAIQAAGMEL